MLWEVEIFPKGPDGERLRVAEEYDLLTHAGHGGTLPSGTEAVQKTSRGFLLQGDLAQSQIDQLTSDLLADPVAEICEVRDAGAFADSASAGHATVLLKPGVMDPAAMSVLQTATQLSIPVASDYTFRRYYCTGKPFDRPAMGGTVLCNEAIEEPRDRPRRLRIGLLGLGTP